MSKRIAVLFVTLLGLGSCTTPKPATPPVAKATTELANKIAAANAVYFARVERADGVAHYIISEVWRHDPALGAAPDIGTEWAGGFSRDASKVHGEAAIIFISPSTWGHGGHTEEITLVSNGRLVDRTTVAELHARVLSSAAAARLEPSLKPSLNDVISHANAIYLAKVEHSAGFIHFFLTEIWRFDPKMGVPPTIGSELLTNRPNNSRIDRPIGYGDHVVIFIFSPPMEIYGGRDSTEITGVFNGYVRLYHMSLVDLHAKVTASTVQADPK